MEEKKIRLQDDLYEYVNGEWLEKAVIPSDRPTTGGFSDLDQNVEKILMGDFKDFADGNKTTDIEEMKYAIKLYQKYIDVEKLNAKKAYTSPFWKSVYLPGIPVYLYRCTPNAPGYLTQKPVLPGRLALSASIRWFQLAASGAWFRTWLTAAVTLSKRSSVPWLSET